MSTNVSVERTAIDREDDHDSPPASLCKDDAYHLLQNARRRAVLRYLFAQAGEEFIMRDVAEAVAAWEHDTTVQQLTSEERQRVYISLYQSHLPKLDEHDIIDYNLSRGLITVRPLATVLAQFLGDGLDAPQTLRAPDVEDAPAESSDGLLSRLGLVSS